jgi:hypothetical protein
MKIYSETQKLLHITIHLKIMSSMGQIQFVSQQPAGYSISSTY